jgi:hypothetical protein
VTRIRHTMGQDWGGRRAANPSDAPRITREQVEQYAQSIGVEIEREGKGMWWFINKDNGKRYTLGQTNYLALEYLKQMKQEAAGEK